MINPILLEKPGADGIIQVFGLACEGMCAYVLYVCMFVYICIFMYVCLLKGENTMEQEEL